MMAGQTAQSNYDTRRKDPVASAASRSIADTVIPEGSALRYAYPSTETVAERTVRRKRSLRRKTAFSRLADFWVMAIGEDAELGRLMGVVLAVCAIGLFYIAAWMNVTYQERTLHTLQVQQGTETARQHELINEIGKMESPGHIADEATKMGMIMTGKADYINVRSAQKARQLLPSAVAIAEADPGDGVQSLP